MNNLFFQDCIDACNECADACDNCATAFLDEKNIDELANCIRIGLDCADICRTASALMSRGSDFIELICSLCVTACVNCADECESEFNDYCRKCVAACRRCAEKCRDVLKEYAVLEGHR